MLEFAVETYAPPQTTSSLAARVAELAQAAEQVSERAAEVRLPGAVFLPADKTGFYLYQAAPPDAVRAAVARGRLHHDRISQAVSISISGPAAEPRAVNGATHPREVRGQR